ncbi:MAG: L-threonylcarbamoyladenylate synthase [Nanoarchaeota archaeon]
MTKENLKKQILGGKIFIYPTDTIYGLGCNALIKESVNKIKKVKKRDFNKPLSVIAPSLKWIKKYCVVSKLNLKKYFPGPYTIILKKKNPKFLSHVNHGNTLGVRIPNHEFTKKIQKTGAPFITTSVNLSSKPSIKKISEVPEDIKNKVDFIIDYGLLSGKPSTLIINGKEVKR